MKEVKVSKSLAPPKPPQAPNVRWVIEIPATDVDVTERATGWWEEHQASDSTLSFESWLIGQVAEAIDDDPFDVYFEWFNSLEKILDEGPRMYISVEDDVKKA